MGVTAHIFSIFLCDFIGLGPIQLDGPKISANVFSTAHSLRLHFSE